MFSSHSFLNRKRSLTGGDARRFSLSDGKSGVQRGVYLYLLMNRMTGELAFELKKKNGDLARENAILKEKCRQLEQKMRALERIDIDIYPDKVRDDCFTDVCILPSCSLPIAVVGSALD